MLFSIMRSYQRVQRAAVFSQSFFIIDRSRVCSPNLITGERMLPVYINQTAAETAKQLWHGMCAEGGNNGSISESRIGYSGFSD